MKIYKLLVLVICSILLFNACEKEELKHECKRGPFHLSFNTLVDGEQFVLNDTLYEDYLGRKYRVELLKFYLSNWALEKQDGSMVSFGAVNLVDYSSKNTLNIDAIIDTGVYVNLHFGVGLDSLMNASDPADFESSNPLSVAQNTYWSWASKYKFFMFEGRVDTLGGQDPNVIFSYHSGFDTLYREITLPLQDLFITSEADSIVLQMDLARVVKGDAGVVDFVDEPFSHSLTDFEIVETISNNLPDAFIVN
ncbi:MAG: hypothetical protein NZ604_07465 [Flavobacteriales bacterium]|nr:hypothetical protein [Flavobacteriales bacterium]